jgi:hypothetical protein
MFALLKGYSNLGSTILIKISDLNIYSKKSENFKRTNFLKGMETLLAEFSSDGQLKA